MTIVFKKKLTEWERLGVMKRRRGRERERVREREREREREGQRERERKRERDRDRKKENERERERERGKCMYIYKWRKREIGRDQDNQHRTNIANCYLSNMLLRSPVYLERLKVRNIPRIQQNILDPVQQQDWLE